MINLHEQIHKAIQGCNPLIYIQSTEEKRVAKIIIKEADDKNTYTWSCINGLDACDDSSKDPVKAVQYIIQKNEPGFYLMQDLGDFLNTPELKRALKEFAGLEKAGKEIFIFIVDPELNIPGSLNKDIHLIIAPPASEEEIIENFDQVKKKYPNIDINDQFKNEIISALKGLTLPEISSILHRLFKSEKTEKKEFFDQLFSEKQMIIRKAGYLEFTIPNENISGMGGNGNLKEWLQKRKKIFTKEAYDAGIPIPKGLLVMGVSGCGKSMAIKTIPALWNIPMYRLDMNLIFSGMYGSPEATFHKALQTLENVAPAVLWIDEIENALGIVEDGLTISSHIFSSFLTWMQEKPPLVFIAATANKINALPAELIRKGRFDQIFFVDLPTEPERKEIFEIYLKKYGMNPENFDLKMLSIMTKNWNCAEIEQVLAAARTDAFYDNRDFTENDITANINKTVPLSTTMESQIKGIRSWAISRATPASKHGKILRF
jgi:ATPase family protein associated with various cellular activities (AAA)